VNSQFSNSCDSRNDMQKGPFSVPYETETLHYQSWLAKMNDGFHMNPYPLVSDQPFYMMTSWKKEEYINSVLSAAIFRSNSALPVPIYESARILKLAIILALLCLSTTTFIIQLPMGSKRRKKETDQFCPSQNTICFVFQAGIVKDGNFYSEPFTSI